MEQRTAVVGAYLAILIATKKQVHRATGRHLLYRQVACGGRWFRQTLQQKPVLYNTPDDRSELLLDHLQVVSTTRLK